MRPATKRTRTTAVVALALGAIIAAGVDTARVHAQTPARAFDVASVKPNMSGDGRMTLQVQAGGRLIITNMTLVALIGAAYRTAASPMTAALRASQIVGGPDWRNRDHYDIDARGRAVVPPGTPGMTPDLQEMLRTLLADRFSLVVHWESREQPVYDLVLARDDKRLGPGLRAVTVDCDALRIASRDAFLAGNGAPAGSRPPCAMAATSTSLGGGGVTIPQFAALLSGPAGRPVRDHTGLDGLFDLSVSWTPAPLTSAASPAAPAPDAPSAGSSGPSIFTALQEQLGLRLESARESIDVLVVDRAEHPSED